MTPDDFAQVNQTDNGVEDEENLDEEYPGGLETEEVSADELVETEDDEPEDDDLTEEEEGLDQDDEDLDQDRSDLEDDIKDEDDQSDF